MPAAIPDLSWSLPSVGDTLSTVCCFSSNFTGSAPVSSEGYTKIKANGVASLLTYSPDGGTTRYCHLSGAGAA